MKKILMALISISLTFSAIASEEVEQSEQTEPPEQTEQAEQLEVAPQYLIESIQESCTYQHSENGEVSKAKVLSCVNEELELSSYKKVKSISVLKSSNTEE